MNKIDNPTQISFSAVRFWLRTEESKQWKTNEGKSLNDKAKVYEWWMKTNKWRKEMKEKSNRQGHKRKWSKKINKSERQWIRRESKRLREY